MSRLRHTRPFASVVLVPALLGLVGACGATRPTGATRQVAQRPSPSAGTPMDAGTPDAGRTPDADAGPTPADWEWRGEPAAAGPRPLDAGPPVASLPAPSCAGWGTHFDRGRAAENLCPDEAASRDLTVVDLSDDWAPDMLDGVPYRSRYVRLADETAPADGGRDRYLSLFGIMPTIGVVRGRLLDRERHRCHDRVNDAALDSLDGTLRPYGEQLTEQRRRARRVRWLEQRLEGERSLGALESLDDLSDDAAWQQDVRQYRREVEQVAAVEAVQAHLACDGLLGEDHTRGVFDVPTALALHDWQRRHMVVSRGLLDSETRRLMAMDSRELDFRSLLRALRERVVDATDLLADGSAASSYGQILGRTLDPRELRRMADRSPLPNAAPDRVAPATQAAARALGWTGPRQAMTFFARRPESATEDLRVAVSLPPRPDYLASHDEMRLEIDRGDVWYEFPYGPNGEKRTHPVREHPTFVLYVTHDGEDIPLVRWNTTVGGWREEVGEDGEVGLRYKGSPVGERIIRDVMVTPAWLPPDSTPDDQLMEKQGDRWVPDQSLIGPGYRSAFGLVMLIHHREVPRRGRRGPRLVDEGIRTHGSVSYRSIIGGYSHGCHRLFNHLAVRLTNFLLAHRDHTREGAQPVGYRRALSHDGDDATLRVRSRGHLVRLDPPVPMHVLEGNIRGPVLEPIEELRELPPGVEDHTAAGSTEEAPGSG